MTDILTVALVSGLCTAVPSLIATVMVNRKNDTLMKYRLNQLEKKMDKHNMIQERTRVLEEQVKVVNHRIQDLESEGK